MQNTEMDELKKSLLTLSDMGIIKDVGALLGEMSKKEFKLKEEKVLSMHKNKITHTQVKRKGGGVKEVYQTSLNGKRPRVNSYEKMIDLLYNAYFEEKTVINDYSFSHIFDLALENKIKEENPKNRTIIDYKNSYKVFISDEFASRDIRKITASDVKKYIQQITQSMNLKQKRFYRFKGILNLTFDYAASPERQIIPFSPVPRNNNPYKKNLEVLPKKPEDKAFQPEQVTLMRNYLWDRIEKHEYDVNGYAVLFSSYTGVRGSEIPSLKWDDIFIDKIHIHSQQNYNCIDGHKEYYYNPTTKNEKGVSHNGRCIPLTDPLKRLLFSLFRRQRDLGIKSPWVFCKRNGDWITSSGYFNAFYKICKKLDLSLTNNHALRMSLNSYTLIPMGLEAPERARFLGHSVETNIKCYTFSRDDEYIREIGEKLNSFLNDY